MTADECAGRESMKTTALGEIKATTHREETVIVVGKKERRGEKLTMGRKGRGNQKEKHSSRQAEHSGEAEEGTQMSSEANREEFQRERVSVRLSVCATVNSSALPAGVCVQLIQSAAHLLASRSVFTPN